MLSRFVHIRWGEVMRERACARTTSANAFPTNSASAGGVSWADRQAGSSSVAPEAQPQKGKHERRSPRGGSARCTHGR